MAISQNSGVQVYPDWWGALGVLALTGLLLHAVNGTMRDRVTLPLIALASLIIVLMRPQNIVFIMGPAMLAVLLVRSWRKPKVMAAMGVGIALGCLRVGHRRLRHVRRPRQPDPPGRAGAAQLEPVLLPATQAKVLSGPWYCLPPTGCQGWDMPGETVWWVAFLAVAVLGLCVGWRLGGQVLVGTRGRDRAVGLRSCTRSWCRSGRRATSLRPSP